jgi:hypothetical protein
MHHQSLSPNDNRDDDDNGAEFIGCEAVSLENSRSRSSRNF